MITQQILINNKTNTIIDADKIYGENQDGIIVSNNNCLKGIPKENLKIQNEYDDGYYYSKENIPDREKRKKTKAFYETENDIIDGYVEKVHYRFGIKNFDFCDKIYNRTSAIVSEYINVNNIDYITISANEKKSETSSVEYYIIDGTSEIPILPEDVSIVKKEKLFYGENTRFIVDNTQYDAILYENGIESTKSYVSLSSYDFEKNEYLLTYMPGSETHEYIPNNDKIKIKIIIRNYGDNFVPIIISGITVNKHGGNPEWI